jgi:hypothetical protein
MLVLAHTPNTAANEGGYVFHLPSLNILNYPHYPLRTKYSAEHTLSTGNKASRHKSEHCAYGHNIATLLNPHSVTTVSHKYSLTIERGTTVVVAVLSTLHYPVNHKIKIYYFR